MPVKMRLQRYGKKGNPYYHLVIADGRAPRDGKYIEKIGMYDPTKNPAQIEIDFDAALSWLQKGAQPTDTVRAILSYKGVLYKHHLLKGVKKGAFDEAQAEVKFQAWLKEKEAKIAAKVSGLEETSRDEKKTRFEAETKIREAREAVFAKKKTVEIEAEVAAAKEAAVETETEAEAEEVPATVAAPAEKPKAEKPKAEEPKAEEPKAEEPKAEEPKAEEPKAEEPKAEEPKAEEPKAEEPKAEEPKAEEPKAEGKE